MNKKSEQKSCNNCGNTEFISKPNRYDVINVINNQVVIVDTELIENETDIYCRSCGEKFIFFE